MESCLLATGYPNRFRAQFLQVTSPKPNSQRSLLRWSLRGLLVLTAITSTLCWRIGINQQYKTTVAEIRVGGGYVYFREQQPQFETKSTTTVNVGGQQVEKPFTESLGDFVYVTDNGKTQRKSVRYTPRTSITSDTVVNHPTSVAISWLWKNHLDEIEMVYLPIGSCTDPMVNRISGLRNMKGLLLSAPKTPPAEALRRLGEIQKELPALTIKTTAPDFQWRRYD